MQTAHYQLPTYFAQAYGACAYGSSGYQQNTTCAASSGVSGGSTLTNTGIAIIGITTLACLILLTTLAVRVWKRPRKTPQTPEQ